MISISYFLLGNTYFLNSSLFELYSPSLRFFNDFLYSFICFSQQLYIYSFIALDLVLKSSKIYKTSNFKFTFDLSNFLIPIFLLLSQNFGLAILRKLIVKFLFSSSFTVKTNICSYISQIWVIHVYVCSGDAFNGF